LLAKIDNALKMATMQIPLNPVQGGHSGAMNSDAAPLGAGGIGHR